MTKLPDHASRKAATTVFTQNIVVTAGAGTGKTSLLVERVLNLVGSGSCELERLAAITFTEKAAAELRFRIAEGLEQLRAAATNERDPDPEEPSGRSYAWLTVDGEVSPADIATRALATRVSNPEPVIRSSPTLRWSVNCRPSFRPTSSVRGCWYSLSA